MFSILWRYPSTRSSSKWWQSPIPRDDNGDIVIVKEIHNEYAACVYGKIKHEWPYYKQVVAQTQYRHLYACCDSSIDECHHVLTPEGEELCHCQRWKQLWDQDVFENYRIWHSWDRPEEEWVGAVKCLADRVMDTFEREDNGQSPPQPLLVFEPPPNNIDFDDFHPYPLTFRDALPTDDVLRLGEDFTSVVPANRNFGYESFEIDRRNAAAEEARPNENASSGHSGGEAGGSDLSSAANGVTTSDVTTNGATTNDVNANGFAASGLHPNNVTANGPTANGFAANSATTNGVTAGVTANNVTTNGVTAGVTANNVTTDDVTVNGVPTNNVTTNGFAANGAANGLTTNGVTAIDFATNGVTTNGVTTNGFTANGSAANGLTTNGITTNGVTTNGFAVDDGTGSHDFDDGVLEDISFEDADPDGLDSDDSVS